MNYITFAVLFTSPKCAFLVVFKAVLLLWIMRVGAFYRDLKQAT
ncbi:putative membrane protein [Raoultella ornithinolytica 2-156-04_S1_C1]|nr:putative membrane protein [Raoultella ornithinolytica 2-156-04_S1_C1]